MKTFNKNSFLPAIILFKPQIGENIGSVARAMKNCGLHDLRIIDPRDGWPNSKTTPTQASYGMGPDTVQNQARKTKFF